MAGSFGLKVASLTNRVVYNCSQQCSVSPRQAACQAALPALPGKLEARMPATAVSPSAMRGDQAPDALLVPAAGAPEHCLISMLHLVAGSSGFGRGRPSPRTDLSQLLLLYKTKRFEVYHLAKNPWTVLATW